MRIKRMLFVLIITAALGSVALADSPLTSTKFAEAYMDEPIVVTASEGNGVITDQLMEYLTGEYNPIDVKMAVINKLGWDIKGKKNSKIFMEYLMKKHGYSSEKKFYRKGSPDELLAMAYLKAMDNYFKVDDALRYAERAVKKNRKSRTFHLIAGLIKAQKAMDKDWCTVYRITDGVRKNRQLMNDMRTGAMNIIYKYMDLYADSCKG